MRFKFTEEGKRMLVAAIIAAVSFFLLGPSIAEIKDTPDKLAIDGIYEGKVLRIVDEKARDPDPVRQNDVEQTLSVRFQLGDQTLMRDVVNDLVPVGEGDGVLVQAVSLSDKGIPVYVIDVARGSGLVWLAALFAVLVMAVSGKKGLYALVGLLYSFVIIFVFIVPRLLAGNDPVFTGLAGAMLILTVTLYVSAGFSKKSVAALLGIFVALLVTAFTADFVIGALHFSGFGGEEAIYLNLETDSRVSLVGLLIAGIIIAAIGVLDDVALTQASAVFELSEANDRLSSRELFSRAMVIGRDHISAVVNTLALAYAGAALPLILLMSARQFPLGFALNGELVAQEVVRTLISSTGLVLAVPLTTAVAVFLAKRSKK